jgi:hypothetical protein
MCRPACTSSRRCRVADRGSSRRCCGSTSHPRNQPEICKTNCRKSLRQHENTRRPVAAARRAGHRRLPPTAFATWLRSRAMPRAVGTRRVRRAGRGHAPDRGRDRDRRDGRARPHRGGRRAAAALITLPSRLSPGRSASYLSMETSCPYGPALHLWPRPHESHPEPDNGSGKVFVPPPPVVHDACPNR